VIRTFYFHSQNLADVYADLIAKWVKLRRRYWQQSL
jgi:hypothetical protein